MDSLRYVVLRHEGHGESHFDLMFETSSGSMLSTWRAAEWPLKPATALEHLADHRADYLNYEGPVSGGRGHVKRVISGDHTILRDDATCLAVQLSEGMVINLPKSS